MGVMAKGMMGMMGIKAGRVVMMGVEVVMVMAIVRLVWW